MTFPLEPSRIPIKIGTIRIVVEQTYIPEQIVPDYDTGEPIIILEHYENSINALIDILDQNNALLSTWSGDLIPYLTDPQKSSLLQFGNNMRAKATSELIP